MLLAEAFDSLVQLLTHTRRYLNHAVKREEIPVSQTLVIESCSMRSLSFQNLTAKPQSNVPEREEDDSKNFLRRRRTNIIVHNESGAA